MQVSNDDLARILGRIEGKIDGLESASTRQESALRSLDDKLTERLDKQELRLRQIEITNPKQIGETVKKHEERISALENRAARAGVVAGIGSSIGIAVLVEFAKRKLGL